MNDIYMPGEAYQALVNELACTLSKCHAGPDDHLQVANDNAFSSPLWTHRLNSMADVLWEPLEPYPVDRLVTAEILAKAEPWPYVEAFDPDQVKWLLGEAGIWPAAIQEEADQDDRPIVLPAKTLRLYERATAENQKERDLIRPHLDPAYVAKVDAMSLNELLDHVADQEIEQP